MSIDRNALAELTEGILSAIGDSVSAIMLYGSSARGTTTNESDVDIAGMVRKALSKEEENRLDDLIVDLNLKYDKVFSVVDIADDEYQKWKNIVPFYKNVSSEGIILWKTA